MKREIHEIVRNVWELDRVIDEEKLSGEAYEISADEIRKIKWNQVSHLHILGQKDTSDLAVLTRGKIRPGYYSASFGSWILILGGTERQIRQAISACTDNLELLDLRFTQLTELDISHLKELRTLWIESNWPLVKLSGFDNLRKIRELDISDSRFCESLDFDRFAMLRSVRMNRSMIRRIQVSQMLPNMEVFDAYGSRLLDASCIRFFPYLQYLNLDDTPVASVPDFMSFRFLKELNLSNIPVTALKAVEYPESIERLCLSGTDLRSVPESIRNMRNLRYLNLSMLKLKELPLWLVDLGLQIHNGLYGEGICLGGTTVDGVDMSLFDQPQEMIKKWFEDRKKGNTLQLNEIKVVFLGDGEAGKSHTIARLINDGGDPVDYTDRSTPGIVIKHKSYQKNGRDIKVHFWDFGGQEILHSMHRIFLTKRTLYVVLVNARDETQDSRARYWLHNVQSFAKDAPVILVLNKIDQNPRADVNERDLRSKYSNLRGVIKLSALKYTKKQFNDLFTDVLLDEIWKTGYLDVSWPVSWTKVKGALEKMSGDYIHGDEYQRICHQFGVDQHRKDLLHWFNDLGVSFCCCDDDDYALDDYVILKPDWITNALYIILFNECIGMRNGLIPHRSIYTLLRAAYNNPAIHSVLPTAMYRNEDIHFVLGVIRKFQLSFMGQSNHEFIPMLCQRESTHAAQEYRDDEKTLEFFFKFDYLPNNVLHRLMVERQHELDLDNVWLTGARFEQRETGLSAVVSIDDNTLRIYVKHEDEMHKPNTYLSMLKTTIDYIWQEMGLQAPEYSLVYRLDGVREEFDYEALKQMRRIGETRVYSKQWRKMLPLVDILNQAAPEGLVSQSELLKTILRSCRHIQGDESYRGTKEDVRNTRMRDDLRLAGYRVYDQTRQGTSKSGKGAGELDLELRTDDDQPWAVVEALRMKHVSAAEWKSHIGRLLFNYNPHGVPVLFLVVYLECDKSKYDDIRKACMSMIQEFKEQYFSYVDGSLAHYKMRNVNFIKYSACQYKCGGYSPKVYHIFVQMDGKDS